MNPASRNFGNGTPPKRKDASSHSPANMTMLRGLSCAAVMIFIIVLVVYRFDRLRQRVQRTFDSNEEIAFISDGGGDFATPSRPSSRLDRLIPEGPPAYSAADLAAWLPDLQREVESLAGRRFQRVPPVRVINRRQLRELLGADEGMDSRFVDDLPGEADIASVMVLGLYDPADGTVYMIPGNLSPLMKHDGHVDQRMVEYTAKLVLVHELAHALQDQQLNLTRLQDSAKNLEEHQALRATIEGHAEMIEDRIAARWDLVRAPREEREPPPISAHASDQELLEYVFDYQDLISELYYIKGSDFFQHNLDRGGPNQVWRILADPPKDTAVFMNPARYWQPGRKGPDADALLAELSSHFGQGWTEERTPLGAFTLRLMYRRLGFNDGDEFVAGIHSAHALQLQRNGSSGFASVMVFDLRHTRDPLKFVLSLERVPPALLNDSDSVIDVTCGNPEIRRPKGMDAKVMREMKVNVVFDSGVAQGRAMRIGRPNCVVEITDVGAGLDDQKCVEIANTVFARMTS